MIQDMVYLWSEAHDFRILMFEAPDFCLARSAAGIRPLLVRSTEKQYSGRTNAMQRPPNSGNFVENTKMLGNRLQMSMANLCYFLQQRICNDRDVVGENMGLASKRCIFEAFGNSCNIFIR